MRTLAFVIGVAIATATTSPCAASAQAVPTTADVHQLAMGINNRIEEIRWHMGRPLEARLPIPVENVAIRENFRQAMTLWRKVNQLGVELVGGGEPPPLVAQPQGGEYGPAEVHLVLTGVEARLEEVRQGVGIVGNSPIDELITPDPVPNAQPDDVFQVIVQANRQVNRMLETEFQPADVYQQVQQSMFYAAEILAAVGNPTPLPAAPLLEPGLTPRHVYGRLLAVFDRLRAAFEGLGLDMVDWVGDAYVADDSLTPSDVFDMATLLLSEFEYLHSRLPSARAPLPVSYPGRRWPSHVYQQAGILSEQSARILVHTRENPEAFVGGR